MNRKDRGSLVLTAVTGQLRDLLQGDPGQVEQMAREQLAADPDNASALLALAAALRLRGDASVSKLLLQSRLRARPNWAAALFELGLAHAELSEHDDALAALSSAGDLWMNRPDLWSALAREWVIARGGDAGGPKDVTADWAHASTDAEAELMSAIKQFPDSIEAQFRVAAFLFSSGRFEEALPHLDVLAQRVAGDALVGTMLATSLARCDRYEEAVERFAELVANQPRRPGLWLGYGRALRALHRIDDAVGAFRKAIALMPGLAEGYWNLASIKTYRFTPGEIEAMRARAAIKGQGAITVAQLNHALGKAMEDDRKFADAFSHYRISNDLLRAASRYNAEEQSAFVRRSIEFFTPEFFAARAGGGGKAADPIFVVGMPRSGSTLVEQILASHSAIEGLGELLHLSALASGLAAGEGRYPELLQSVDPARFTEMGMRYLALCRPRRGAKPSFVDKLPGNFVHVGLIHLILPNARIVDVRRHPLDCCLSCFKSYLPAGIPFTHSLDDIGRYYRDYVQLMAHFDTVLPGRVHRIFYEKLIAEPEKEVRRLLAALGLPFEERCLRFHEQKRAVVTLSAEQVHQPLYADAVGYWRNFEPWLGPLRDTLGDVLTRFPEVPNFPPDLRSSFRTRMSWN